MAIVGQITGSPGTGKTCSLETMNPKHTLFIDVDRKGLAWAGWRSNYNTENKNYAATANPALIAKILRDVSDNRPEVKCVVIDTINSLMSVKEMSERKKNGFDERKTCRIKISLIAGISLELCTLQRNHEIWISVNV